MGEKTHPAGNKRLGVNIYTLSIDVSHMGAKYRVQCDANTDNTWDIAEWEREDGANELPNSLSNAIENWLRTIPTQYGRM